MRLVVLIASGALMLAAPAWAQTAPAQEEAPAAAAAPAPTPDAATPAPAAEAAADPVVCREVQRVGSRLRSQRDRYCARQSVWDGEEADTRERINRVNAGQSIASPTGRGGLE